MDMLKLMQTRFASRQYDSDRRVSDEDFAALLEACRLSPSSLNCQPWEFLYTGDRAVLEQLKTCMPEGNHPRLNASHLIVFAAKTQMTDEWLDALTAADLAAGMYAGKTVADKPDAFRRSHLAPLAATQEKWDAYAAQQLYLALGCATVAAAGLGLNTTILGGFDREALSNLLSLQEKGLKPVVLLAVGYKAENDPGTLFAKSRVPAEMTLKEIKL